MGAMTRRFELGRVERGVNIGGDRRERSVSSTVTFGSRKSGSGHPTMDDFAAASNARRHKCVLVCDNVNQSLTSSRFRALWPARGQEPLVSRIKDSGTNRH